MPNRVIKESITTSDSIDKLSLDAECFWYRLIVNCDDFGRMDGRTSVLLAKCFPLRVGRIKEAQIKTWLGELVRGKFLFLYRNGHEYLQITKWDDHQQVRAKRSKYPAPDDDGIQLISDDISGNQLHANVTVIQSNPNPNPNPKRELAAQVFLTDDEKEKLVDKFGQQSFDERIEKLSLYKQSTGKTYKSDYATILSWAKKDEATPTKQKPLTFIEKCAQIAQEE